MKLTKEQIDEFIKIWEKEFGETPNREVAETEARRLINFAILLTRGIGKLPPEENL